MFSSTHTQRRGYFSCLQLGCFSLPTTYHELFFLLNFQDTAHSPDGGRTGGEFWQRLPEKPESASATAQLSRDYCN